MESDCERPEKSSMRHCEPSVAPSTRSTAARGQRERERACLLFLQHRRGPCTRDFGTAAAMLALPSFLLATLPTPSKQVAYRTSSETSRLRMLKWLCALTDGWPDSAISLPQSCSPSLIFNTCTTNTHASKPSIFNQSV